MFKSVETGWSREQYVVLFVPRSQHPIPVSEQWPARHSKFERVAGRCTPGILVCTMAVTGRRAFAEQATRHDEKQAIAIAGEVQQWSGVVQVTSDF